MAFIDPLSKGDTKFFKNRMGNVADSFTVIRNKLTPHGIILQVGSKDKVSGIDNIKRMLRGPNGMPIMYLFNNLPEHRHQIMRWVFGDDGLPAKENDHFPENWYRYTLFNIGYTNPASIRRSVGYQELGII